MIIYAQRDAQWAALQLASSGLTCGRWGCYCTAIAELLTIAGWNVTPAEVIVKLNQNGGFTNDGLVIWAKVTEAFPQFHYGGSGYQLVQGKFPASYHYMARVGDTLYDPWTATNTAPCPLTGYVQNIGIDPAPVPEPVEIPDHFAPFEINLSPSQVYNDEVKRMQEFLIKKQFMDDQGQNDGYYGPITQHAVNGYQKAHGIISSPIYFGWWWNQTRAQANKDL